MGVLYGDLSFEKRTSRKIRNTFGSPSGCWGKNGSIPSRSSARSAFIGRSQPRSYSSRCAANHSRLWFLASCLKKRASRSAKRSKRVSVAAPEGMGVAPTASAKGCRGGASRRRARSAARPVVDVVAELRVRGLDRDLLVRERDRLGGRFAGAGHRVAGDVRLSEGDDRGSRGDRLPGLRKASRIDDRQDDVALDADQHGLQDERRKAVGRPRDGEVAERERRRTGLRALDAETRSAGGRGPDGVREEGKRVSPRDSWNLDR